MEKNVDLFLKETNYCKMCGSQRCDRTIVWVKGCQHFKKYVKEMEKR